MFMRDAWNVERRSNVNAQHGPNKCDQWTVPVPVVLSLVFELPNGFTVNDTLAKAVWNPYSKTNRRIIEKEGEDNYSLVPKQFYVGRHFIQIILSTPFIWDFKVIEKSTK